MRVTIHNDSWKIALIKKSKFKKKHGSGIAITELQKKKITFINGNLTLETLRHELFHAFFSYTCTGSSNMDGDQAEEVMAEWLSKNLEVYTDTCKIVTRMLKKELT